MTSKLGLLATVAAALLGIPATAVAHGESVRGVGSTAINTVGGAVSESVSAGIRYDMRRYRQFSPAALIDFRAQGEDVHQHASEHTVFLSLGIPLAKNVDLNLLLQGNGFRGFSDNGDEFVDASCSVRPGSGDTSGATAQDCISTTRASTGLGDMLALARWRFFQRGDNHLAGLFGLIAPTGGLRSRVDKRNPRTGRRELVGTHNQPGGGAFSAQLGLAHSSLVAGRLGISSDVLVRANGPGAYGFRQGNGAQADVAFSYGKAKAVVVPVLEFNAISQLRDIEDGEVKRNSGGSVVYASPGISLQLGSHQLYASFSYPLWQRLGGISNLEAWRAGVGYGLSFDFLRRRREAKGDRKDAREHGHDHEQRSAQPATHDERSR